MRLFTCIFLIFALRAISIGQSFFNLPEKVESVKIPFKLYRNIIVIPVYLNNTGPYNFILDTGAGHCIITDPAVTDSLQLQKGREVKIYGAGNDTASKAFLVHNIQVQFNKVSSVPLTFSSFEIDPFLISSFLGLPIHGILGFEFFRSFIVEIDFKKSRLVLIKPDAFRLKKGFDQLPLVFQANKPYLLSTLQVADTILYVKFLLDTGAGFPIMIELETQTSEVLPEKIIEAELGVGLNGPVNGFIGRVPVFSIGNFKMENVVAGFPQKNYSVAKQSTETRQGSIGNYILNRFHLILDYGNGIIYLKPNANLQKPFPYDRAGVEVIAYGEAFNRIVVQWVKYNSPAAEAGVLAGDEIIEINNRKISHFTLEAIDSLLSSPETESLVLKIFRHGLYYNFVISLNDII